MNIELRSKITEIATELTDNDYQAFRKFMIGYDIGFHARSINPDTSISEIVLTLSGLEHPSVLVSDDVPRSDEYVAGATFGACDAMKEHEGATV